MSDSVPEPRILLTTIQKHPDAKPFKKKGFVHYNQMAIMLPNLVKGTHAFRPSQQSFGAVANQPANSGSPPAESASADTGGCSVGAGLSVAPGNPLMQSRSPPSIASTSNTPNTNSVHSFNSRQSKCKHSALGDGDTMSINSNSPAGSQDKCQRGGQTSALYALGVKVNKINETFASGFAAEDKAHIHRDHSPQRRAKAGEGIDQ